MPSARLVPGPFRPAYSVVFCVSSQLRHGCAAPGTVIGRHEVIADQPSMSPGSTGDPIGLVALMVISSETGVMGGDAVGGGLRLAGWAVTGVITSKRCLLGGGGARR